MKVVRVNKPGNLEICEVEIPEILKANEVLLKVKAAGICGSDMHIFQGTSPVATYPRIIGHEFAGEIVQVGSQVKDCGKGDHVVINPVISCGTCYPCSIGRNNVCTDLKVRGVHTDGGYAEDIFSDMLTKEYSQMAGKQGLLAELNKKLVAQLRSFK